MYICSFGQSNAADDLSSYVPPGHLLSPWTGGPTSLSPVSDGTTLPAAKPTKRQQKEILTKKDIEKEKGYDCKKIMG